MSAKLTGAAPVFLKSIKNELSPLRSAGDRYISRRLCDVDELLTVLRFAPRPSDQICSEAVPFATAWAHTENRSNAFVGAVIV
jgi:hypothetical protein